MFNQGQGSSSSGPPSNQVSSRGGVVVSPLSSASPAAPTCSTVVTQHRRDSAQDTQALNLTAQVTISTILSDVTPATMSDPDNKKYVPGDDVKRELQYEDAKGKDAAASLQVPSTSRPLRNNVHQIDVDASSQISQASLVKSSKTRNPSLARLPTELRKRSSFYQNYTGVSGGNPSNLYCRALISRIKVANKHLDHDYFAEEYFNQETRVIYRSSCGISQSTKTILNAPIPV
ncbi:hypothetical protein M0804_013113 [Polistes exclamans]|nr:hypothetical protein M0804_013113 [Polistes exclamans]